MLLIWAIYLINIHRTVCTLLNAELILPRGDQITQGKIIRRAKDNEGRPIGRRLVANGSRTEATTSSTYTSVVSRDSACIAFLMAALERLKICAAEVGDAYWNAPTHEELRTVAERRR